MVDKAQVFHEHFYEEYLDDRASGERWEEIMDLLKKVRKTVIFSSK